MVRPVIFANVVGVGYVVISLRSAHPEMPDAPKMRACDIILL